MTFGISGQRQIPITADYSVQPNDDAVIVGSSVTAPVTVSLYTAAGRFAGNRYVNLLNPGVGQSGGELWIINKGSSTVAIAPSGSDAVLGPLVLGPGESMFLQSDGGAQWFCAVSGAAGSSSLQVVVPITAANIKAMYGAPVEVIAAPGANKLIVVDSITTKIVTTATQFANGGAVIFQYDSTVHGAGVNAVASTIPAATINAAAGTAINQQGPAAAADGTVAPLNKGVFISNDTAAFITGTGTLNATVKYRVLTP